MTKPRFLLRAKTTIWLIYLGFFLVALRLFYWQVIQGDKLTTQAYEQSQRQITHQGQRGKIYTADGHLLVGNAQAYKLIIAKDRLELPHSELINQLAPILVTDPNLDLATAGAELQPEQLANFKDQLQQRLQTKKNWLVLTPRVSQHTKNQLDQLEVQSLQFASENIRYYPEASMAAHVLG
ncbi:MAG: hypothetical protein GF390_03480, partial [Candidatus Pacebacteria bacterium]|nr:hypothetical protein [Candidatus Paceibacterota bacterium]